MVAIVDGAVDSIGAARKILAHARSDPSLIKFPATETPLKTATNAAIFAAAILFAIRLTLYPLPNNADNWEKAFQVGLNAAVALTSLVPIVAISLLSVLTRSDEDSETAADRWSYIFSFIWIVTLLLRLIDGFYSSILFPEESVGLTSWIVYLAGIVHVVGQGHIGKIPIDAGFFASSLFFSAMAIGLLNLRTNLLTPKDARTPRQWGTVLLLGAITVFIAFLLYFTVEFGRPSSGSI